MRTRKTDLDVDFIGGQGSLTNDEEKALSDFFKKRKQNKVHIKPKTTDRPNTHA